MKLIVAGPRDLILKQWMIDGALQQFNLLDVTEIVSGACPTGVDNSAEAWALNCSNNKGEYPKLTRFPADWGTHGKSAGPIRNRQMAEYGDALLLIWRGDSPGSRSMLKEMYKLGKPVYEVILKGPK